MLHVSNTIHRPVLSLLLAAALGIGMTSGAVAAQVPILDSDRADQPVVVGDIHFPMSVAQSQKIADQLAPVAQKLTYKTVPHPAVPQWLVPKEADDPFMRDDAYLYAQKGYKPGQIIRKRKASLGKYYYPGATTMQYAFLSYDGRGYPMTATASLVIPKNLKPNAAVFQWVQFINAAGPKCSVGTQLNDSSSKGWSVNPIQIAATALALGHPVLLPDGMGPRASYGINRNASHVLLDSMRMVHQQTDFPLSESTFASLGISHGALMNGYTAVEQPYYAPDLNPYIKQFIVNEGAPDFIKLASTFGLFGNLESIPSLGGTFIVSFIVGAIREYGDMLPNIERWLTPYGHYLLTENANRCMPDSWLPATGGVLKYLFKEGFQESQSFRTLMQVAKEASSLYFPGIPQAPVLLVHGTRDQLVQDVQDAVLHKRWCAAGANVVYQRIPGAGHLAGPVIAIPRMVKQTVDAFEGKTQTPICDREVVF